ncbi:MAG: hypothetical protein GXY72_09455 [Deltaproteobacteria bacterium]|nr:hypothetical protein [Deltaproteobacteria bacterium]
MTIPYLHDDAGLPRAWSPWFSHEYIAYFCVKTVDRLTALPPVPVAANPRWQDKVWPAGPRHIDIYKECYQEHRQVDPLWSFDQRKRNGDFARDVPPGKSIEPWKIYLLYSTEPDTYADEDLLLHKNQAMTGGSRGWRHMHFKLMGSTYGIAPKSFRVHRDLARLAFSKGSDYWAWRYLARAGHYLADLGAPFHVRAMPGFYLLRNIFSRGELFHTVTALHQSYEIFVERRFREGFAPFAEALTRGAKEGQGAPEKLDARLKGYIERARSRQKKIFYHLHDGFGPELRAAFAPMKQGGGHDTASLAARCAADAVRILFKKEHQSRLARLEKITCGSLADVGWMQGALLGGFQSRTSGA